VLGGLVSSRRGRDLVILATGVIALGLFLLTQSLHGLIGSFAGVQSASASSVLSWLPPGAAGQALVSAADGAWWTATVRLGVVILAGVLFALLWAWGIGRRLDGKGGGSGGHRSRRSATDSDTLRLIPLPVRAFTARPVSASLS